MLLKFNPNTCYLIIELYLNKDIDIICPICGHIEIKIRGSKLSINIILFVNIHRRIYKCHNDHYFLNFNSFLSVRYIIIE